MNNPRDRIQLLGFVFAAASLAIPQVALSNYVAADGAGTGLPPVALSLPSPVRPAIDAGAWAALTPPGRVNHSAIYDPIRHRMIIFGGRITGWDAPYVLLNDAWELTLGADPVWRNLSPGGPTPAPRELHSAIYDPEDNRMIVFGGVDLSAGETVYGDVWELSLGAEPIWTELVPGGTPTAPRCGHSAIYDEPRGRMIVFGGYDLHDDEMGNDVWELTLGAAPTWNELVDAAAPLGRYDHSAVYDPLRDRMLVFGGGLCSPEFFCGVPDTENDLWELSLSGEPVWTEILPSGDPPESRRRQVAVFDPVRDRLVIDGGWRSVGCTSDTWAVPLSGSLEWVQLAPLGDRWPHCRTPGAVYDPVGDRIIEYLYGEVWALLLADPPEWTTDLSPRARLAHSAIYADLGRVVLFGGSAGGVAQNDVWEIIVGGSAGSSEVTPAGTPPGARYEHSAVHDAQRNAMVVFGGTDDTQYFSDTWMLSLAPGSAAWAEISSTTSPPPRAGHSAVLDPQGDQMLVFGGRIGTTPLNDLWALPLGTTGGSWTEIMPSGSPPPPRSGHAAVYYPAVGGFLVFGGFDGASYLNDLWGLQLGGTQTPTWSPLFPGGAPPPPRRGHTGVYDPVRSRIVFFGGCGATNCFDDAWELSFGGPTGPTWTQLVPTGDPPRGRYGHISVYDALRDRMLVFGGNSGCPDDSCNAGDLWALEWSNVVAVSVSESSERPSVSQFAPNPARSRTRIMVEGVNEPTARVRIYTVAGRLVREIQVGSLRNGSHEIWWDGRQVDGSKAPNGLYFARVQLGGNEHHRKIVLAR